MRDILTKVEDFFASLVSRLSRKPKEKDEKNTKKPGFFDKIDAYFTAHDGSFLIWSFILSAVLMLLVYVSIGVYPFGKNSVLVLDLNGQYVQFFAGLRAILHGDGSLLYSFSRSLGGEFLGIYAYYLASPFSWLVALFPEQNILEALLLIFVLKSGFSGLNFGIFLHYTRRPPKTMTVSLSILYALSSYVVVMQHNTMWIDAVMLLPLLIFGLERLIREKKPLLYAFTLGLILLSNYYIGYMVCIFTALYFFYYFAAHSAEVRNPYGERRHFLCSLLRVGVYTLLGIGVAAMMILPAYYSLSFGKTTFSTGNFAFTSKFEIIDFIAKMFPGSYDTVRPEGLPWVYSGTLSLLLLPLFFAAGKIKVREKIATGVLLFFLFLSMYINTLDVLWHGGQAPNWLNYRYSFVFIFVVLLMGARTLSALRSVDYRAILAVASTLLILVVILQKLKLTYTANNKTEVYFDNLNGVWLSIGLLIVFGILLLFLNGHDRTSPRYEPLATILLTVLCIEVLLNGVFYMRRQHEDVVISNYASYHDFYDEYAKAFDYVKENDTSFYRMDKTFQRTVCDSFVLGYRGLASSTSTLNASVVRFQRELGMKADSHWTEATGSTIATNALLGVKYWVAKEGEAVHPHYQEYHRDGDTALGTATVTYLNPYALPIAFASSPAVKDITYAMPADPVFDSETGESLNDGGYVKKDNQWVLAEEWEDALFSPFMRLNATYSAMTGIEELTVYHPIEADISMKGGLKKDPSVWNHLVYKTDAQDKDGRLCFTFTAESTDPVYCYFPSKYTRKATVYLNGEKLTDIQYYDYILTLDSLKAGMQVEVELALDPASTLYLVEDIPYFYTVDTEDLARATDILKAGGISLTEARDDFFKGTITAKEGMTTVQTTIPFDEGWQITVDGEAVPGYRTLDAMLAFNLPEAGEHEITLRYRPSVYGKGLAISIVSLVLLGAVLTLIILRNRKKMTIKGENLASGALLFFLPLPKAEEKNCAPCEEDMPEKSGDAPEKETASVKKTGTKPRKNSTASRKNRRK